MTSLADENDERCQHRPGCSRSFFTFCPHCRLFLCMTHLNEHHDLMKTEWSQIFDDVKQQKTIVEEQIEKLHEQKDFFNEFFQNEIENLTKNLSLITNLCRIQPNDHENQPLTNGYEKRIEELKTIKKLQIPRAQTLIRQIDEFLQRISFEPRSSTESEEISSTFDVVPIVDDETSIQSNWSTESDFLCSCPLSDVNVFGLVDEHAVPGVPCTSTKNNTNLTSTRCFHHLLTFHHLKPKVARMILDFLSSPENRSTDPKTIDLFSKWPMKEVVSQSIGLYVRLCPLTIDRIYGLKSGENYELCQPRAPVHLEQHLRTVHHFKHECSRRFIKALIDGEPFHREIFHSNENVIDATFRLKYRRKRQTIRSRRKSSR